MANGIKLVFAIGFSSIWTAGIAYASFVPTPAPLVGAVGGPFGLVAAVVCYGGYRWFKATRAKNN